MTDSRATIRTLVIYGVCIPLALLLGYLLANQDIQGLTMIGLVFLVLCAPLVIHHHYPFMLLAWNSGAVVFFLPGRMNLWIVAIALSFAVAFTHRIMDKRVRFISVPELTRPLIFLAIVVIATAELRGGFGLRSMGGETVGARRYFEILVGVLGFFALTTRPIPRDKAKRYIALFYLGSVAALISILYGRVPSAFNFIFLLVPPQTLTSEEGEGLFLAFRPMAWAGGAVFACMLAQYGIRGLLAPGRRFALLFFLSVVGLTLLSGSRLILVTMAMTVLIQFLLEGLHRTKLLWAALTVLVFATVATVPFVSRLPLQMQRALAVLPIEVDPVAKATADASSEWRKEIWRVMIPQIPQYLLLGKGYAMSRSDLALIHNKAFSQYEAENRAATIAGDYHNGPLSVVIPLGLWGAMAFLWLLGAGFGVLWRNYRYGDAEVHTFNTYLLTSYMVTLIIFFFVFGSLQTGLVGITGILGLSVALNGGVAKRRAPEPIPLPQATKTELRRREGPVRSPDFVR